MDLVASNLPIPVLERWWTPVERQWGGTSTASYTLGSKSGCLGESIVIDNKSSVKTKKRWSLFVHLHTCLRCDCGITYCCPLIHRGNSWNAAGVISVRPETDHCQCQDAWCLCMIGVRCTWPRTDNPVPPDSSIDSLGWWPGNVYGCGTLDSNLNIPWTSSDNCGMECSEKEWQSAWCVGTLLCDLSGLSASTVIPI